MMHSERNPNGIRAEYLDPLQLDSKRPRARARSTLRQIYATPGKYIPNHLCLPACVNRRASRRQAGSR